MVFVKLTEKYILIVCLPVFLLERYRLPYKRVMKDYNLEICREDPKKYRNPDHFCYWRNAGVLTEC